MHTKLHCTYFSCTYLLTGFTLYEMREPTIERANDTNTSFFLAWNESLQVIVCWTMWVSTTGWLLSVWLGRRNYEQKHTQFNNNNNKQWPPSSSSSSCATLRETRLIEIERERERESLQKCELISDLQKKDSNCPNTKVCEIIWWHDANLSSRDLWFICVQMFRRSTTLRMYDTKYLISAVIMVVWGGTTQSCQKWMWS